MPLGVQEGPRTSRQLAHEGGKVVSPLHWPSLSPSKSYTRYSFLLEAKLTPGPQWCWRGMKTMKNPNDPIGNRTRDLKTLWYICIPTAMMMATIRNHSNTGNLGNKENCSNHGSYTWTGLKVFSSITNKMQCYIIYLFLWNGLHVSGSSSAHHKELKTVYTASGTLSNLYCYLPRHIKSDGTQHTKARLREVLKEKWKNSVMHGQYIRNKVRQLISEEDTFLWLSKGDLKAETESEIVAAQDQALQTK